MTEVAMEADDSGAAAQAAAAKATQRPKLTSTSSEAGDDKDQHKLEITVGQPERVGDGMSAYIVYKVQSKTTIPTFKSPDTSVMRRYSDFYNLHGHLVEKYAGVIVPPVPPKDAIGTGVMKFKNAGSEVTPFIERRAAALGRFLARVAQHPVLRKDDMLRLFLESEDRLPKPKSSIMSVLGKLGGIGDADEWFDDKAREIDTLEAQLKKTHAALESLVTKRKELSVFTSTFAESLAALADAEEVQALTKAMHQLADVEAKVAALHFKQANRDFYDFSEIMHDYLGLISAIKDCFYQRQSAHKAWQSAEGTLHKKKDNVTKLRTQGKTEKIDQAEKDVTSAEEQVASAKKDFEEVSKRLRLELGRFDALKVRDFQATLIEFVEAIMTTQHQVVKAWEQFLPEAKAIGTA
eukprot:m.262696 g.262696  ORF g.262696 m.262696 type:complete len:408 (+) comp22762_c17_seq3:821-2044(+)